LYLALLSLASLAGCGSDALRPADGPKASGGASGGDARAGTGGAGSGGATGSGGAPGAHPLSGNPVCPREIPAPPTWTSPLVPATGGTSCSGSATCEYGASSANPACNTFDRCVTRKSSCNGPDDCQQSLMDQVWDVTPPDAARCQAPVKSRDPGAGCPAQRPPLGDACTKDNLSCTYSCAFGGEACLNGFWSAGNVAPECLGSM